MKTSGPAAVHDPFFKLPSRRAAVPGTCLHFDTMVFTNDIQVINSVKGGDSPQLYYHDCSGTESKVTSHGQFYV